MGASSGSGAGLSPELLDAAVELSGIREPLVTVTLDSYLTEAEHQAILAFRDDHGLPGLHVLRQKALDTALRITRGEHS